MSKEVSPLVAALIAPPTPKSPIEALRAEVAADPALGDAIHTARSIGKSSSEIAAILSEHLSFELPSHTVKKWLSESS
jgi:hypothetical protein